MLNSIKEPQLRGSIFIGGCLNSSEELKVKNKRKPPQKPEDFIGWKSPEGRLEVIGIAGKQGRNTTFKVICTECSKDRELFPLGYFINKKSSLLSGQIPCGCSKCPRWEDWQYLILARREGAGKFEVIGFVTKFRNCKNTKLRLKCLHDGFEWSATIDSVINHKKGCPKCSGVYRPTDMEAFIKCENICLDMNYKPIGFIGGTYKGAHKTKFEYVCQKHGTNFVIYDRFVNGGTRCPACWKERQIELGNGNGYYPERKDEQDFLYVLNFNGKFIKVGRSFDVDDRIDNLKTPSVSGIKNIIKLRIFTATHQEIYDYEQFLLNSLRPNFKYYCDWSTETLVNPSLPILNDLLDTTCKFKELKLEGV